MFPVLHLFDYGPFPRRTTATTATTAFTATTTTTTTTNTTTTRNLACRRQREVLRVVAHHKLQAQHVRALP